MSTPFLLAPMAELSHRALRELIEGFRSPNGEGGADEYFTEMISAGALVGGGPFEEWYLDGEPRPEKLVYQIAGGDEEQLCGAAALLDQRECLGIDVNMGCSAPAITRTGAGVRWMADIDRAGALIRRLRSQTRRRLSVKLRTGPDDNFEYLVRFCRRLEDEGVDFITLHPRTAREKFRRSARWEYVSALKKELRIPLAGNGDISSAKEMIRRGEECDAVMTGRLAVRRPWIFAEAGKIRAGSAPTHAPDGGADGVSPAFGSTPDDRQDALSSGVATVEPLTGGADAVLPAFGSTPGDRQDALSSGVAAVKVPAGATAAEPLTGGADAVPPAVVSTPGDRQDALSPGVATAKPLTGADAVDLEETGGRFLELLSRHQPPEFHLSRARRFFSYFCDNLKWGNYVKNLLNRETDIAGIGRAWRDYFTERPEEKTLFF